MEDARIIDLYFSRSEEAIGETAAKYGPYCASIAMSILNDPEDAEESVNDTWLAAWNRMPPERPNVLAVFLGRMTRNISIDRWRQYHSFKRSGSQVTLALEELDGCVSGKESLENELIRRETLGSIQRFLDTLTPVERAVFVCRYWYLDNSKEIADQCGFSRGKVRTMLRRIRIRLMEHLKKEGLA